jgi:hypothetical protein
LDGQDLLPFLESLTAKFSQARDLEDLSKALLDSVSKDLRFEQAMLLVPDPGSQRLVVLASRGYKTSGIGSEVLMGQGLMGQAALARQSLVVGSAVIDRAYAESMSLSLGPQEKLQVPWPGLEKPMSLIAVPLVARDTLFGLLYLESKEGFRFRAADERLLNVAARLAAAAMQGMRESERPGTGKSRPKAPAKKSAPTRLRRFQWVKEAEAVFVDGEYLIKNVPARILWKLLKSYQKGQTDFQNKALRADKDLGLPEYRDNLESRLILLRGRLAELCPELKLVSLERGRFRLEADCKIQLRGG